LETYLRQLHVVPVDERGEDDAADAGGEALAGRVERALAAAEDARDDLDGSCGWQPSMAAQSLGRACDMSAQ
jgi:hypothetical protein